MKQYIRFALLSLTLMGAASDVWAEAQCPEGMQSVINPQTNEVFCIMSASPSQKLSTIQQNEQSVQVQKEEMEQNREDSILAAKERTLKSSGFMLEFGMGYALVLAFDFHFLLGYSFSEATDGVSFGLYTDIDAVVGYPYALSWAVVPMIHINGSKFRGSVGIGPGLFTTFPGNDYYDDEGGIEDDTETYFALKPEVRCDWFLSSHIYMGFGLDFPILFISDDKNNHHVGSWLDIHLQVGYKF